MITDDEVMRFFERADPARFDDDAVVIDAAGYLDALRTRSSDMPVIETTPIPTEPTSRHRWWMIAAAAAAAVLLAVGAIVLVVRDDSTEPATDQPPIATEAAPETLNANAAEVAQGFVEAWRAFDADGAIAYLADDADIAGLIDWVTTEDVQGTVDELRMLLSVLEATHYQQMLGPCDELSRSATDTTIRCTFDFQTLRSDELGLGPLSGNSLDLTVRDGQIVGASYHNDSADFSPEVWEPFASWMDSNHPEDAAIIFSPSTPDGGMGSRLTAEAIPLWEQRTQEYVQVVLTSREAYLAEVGGICANQATQLGELAAPAEGALDQVAAWNAAAATILDQAHGELIALEKPLATDTAAYSTFYGQLARVARVVDQAAEAATAGDSARLAELDAEYVDVRRAMSSGPAGSGLEQCLQSLPS